MQRRQGWSSCDSDHVHNSLSREENFLDSRRHRLGYEIFSGACATADVVVCPTSAVRDDEILVHLPSIRQERRCRPP